MIEKQQLVVGNTYDGFVWYRHRQTDVGEMMWLKNGDWPGGYFKHEAVDSAYQLHDPEGNGQEVTFEPNVVNKVNHDE